MKKGKVLKVRTGHEANCSSGMYMLSVLILGGLIYLPLSLITSAVHLRAQRAEVARGKPRRGSLIYPLATGLGIGIAGILTLVAFDIWGGHWEALLIAIAIVCAFAIATVAGYRLAPTIRAWTILVEPLMFAVIAIVLMVAGIWLALVL